MSPIDTVKRLRKVELDEALVALLGANETPGRVDGRFSAARNSDAKLSGSKKRSSERAQREEADLRDKAPKTESDSNRSQTIVFISKS